MESWGPKPDRPGDVKRGTLKEAVPLAEFTSNFSPIPRKAPPPFGRDRLGGLEGPLSEPVEEALSGASAFPWD